MMPDNTDFEAYFKGLGYNISWDCSRKTGESWWEILDPQTDRLILQIDNGVPLNVIIGDLVEYHTGIKSTVPYGKKYKMSGPETEATANLYRKVYENQNLKPKIVFKKQLMADIWENTETEN